MPSHGHRGADGYSRGVCLPTIAEVDVVDIYVKYIQDQLEEHGVRYKVCPTRVGPGMAEVERGTSAAPFTLILHCAVGALTDERPQTTNISRVLYSGVGKACAEEMSDCLNEWGGLYVHGHRRGNAYIEKVLGVQDCMVMRLEPFVLNGPSAGEYLKRLPALGRDIGRLVCEWTKQRGQGAIRASTLAF